ncbi:MAG TPA: hypothetical protein VFR92_10725 [Sphingomicrobium sp.]|jgi:hypothetical protein|nr:hypothetical protein [Sphingomicrobium sp.]
MSSKEAQEGPRQLGERFWRELCELVAGGDISNAFARRLIDDIFEPMGEGQPPVVKWSVWCAHVDEQQKLSDLWAQRQSRF